MNTLTVSAHFDGEKILLDEPYKLEPNTPLLVTILPAPTHAGSAEEEERQDWLRLSLHGLAAAYGEDEPEYTIDMVKELNPDYQRR
jgi:hypothetical protein